MAEYQHQPTITIVVTRCFDCRRHYGFEKFQEERCPHCAKDTTTELHATINKLEKSNRALRGAITRLSK